MNEPAPANQLPREDFDLADIRERYGSSRDRRNSSYFFGGTAAILTFMFLATLASITEATVQHGLLSGVGIAFLTVVSLLVVVLLVLVVAILSGRDPAVALSVDRDGVEFRYPSGRRERRSWKDPKACIDLYEHRVTRALSQRRNLRVGEIYYSAAPPHVWSPHSWISEPAYASIQAESKRQGLSFTRLPLYGGWGYTITSVIRVSANRPKTEKLVPASSV